MNVFLSLSGIILDRKFFVATLLFLFVSSGVHAHEYTKACIQHQSEDTVYYYVEKRAAFPGGEDELARFISRTLHYPKDARRNKIEGRVIVQFIVEPDGKVSTPTVLSKDVHKSLKKEAKRIVKQLPPWQPAEHHGKHVRVYVTIPITFRLS